MICENAYYEDGRLCCKVMNDEVFGDKCPLIYYCTITGKFENTDDFLECKYRKETNHDEMAST